MQYSLGEFILYGELNGSQYTAVITTSLKGISKTNGAGIETLRCETFWASFEPGKGPKTENLS